MGDVEQDLTKFKLQLGPEWQKLHTAKWRRPKWIKFPRSMLDDARWLRLSPQAAKAWMHILVIASERENLELPAPDLLFIRLRSTGDVQKRTTFAALINELIQCSFLLKTTPEYQSFRVPKLQIRKERSQSPAREASRGFASPAQTKRLGEEGRVEPSSSRTTNLPESAETMGEIARGAEAGAIRLNYGAGLRSFRPITRASRRCAAFLTVSDYLAGLAPELADPSLLKRSRDERFLIEDPIGDHSA
jgi:hypothetical protein